MLTTIEAEIDVNGKVTLLEPLKIAKKSRVIITFLEDEKPLPDSKCVSGEKGENDRQLEWLKANRNKYAGKYVALEGDSLVAHGDSLPEIRRQTKNRKNLFIVKIFAEETIVSAGL